MHSPEFQPIENKEQSDIGIETFDGKNLPDGVRDEVQEYIREEGQVLEGKRGSAAANHALYLLRALDDASKHERQTFLILAREHEKVVGAGSLIIRPDADLLHRVELLYVGRAFDQSKKGIGSKILLAEHEILRNHGIRFYTTRVHEDSMKLYEQLGVKHQVTPGSKESDIWEIVVRLS